MLGTAMGGFLMAATAAVADVPKPTAPVQGNAAEAKKLLAEAQAALKSGNLRLALIHLKKAIQVAPSNSNARIQFGLALFQSWRSVGGGAGNTSGLEGRCADATVLPILFQVMLAREEYQELVDEFPDPGASNSSVTTNLLKARAFALQRLGRGPEAVDALDRSLKIERDAQGLLARANLALQQGDFSPPAHSSMKPQRSRLPTSRSPFSSSVF